MSSAFASASASAFASAFAYASASTSLIVSGIEEQYNVAYIANTFWNLNIAKVSSITLTSNGVAYVEIRSWCDSENAYNFIKRLNNVKKETRLVHYQDDWWVVSKNNKGSYCDCSYAYCDCEYITFDDSYFEKKYDRYRRFVNNMLVEELANEIAIRKTAARSQHVTVRNKLLRK